MDLFDELLGFAVLTGPLWLILLLLPLTVWVAARVSRRFTPGRARWVTGAGVFVLAFLLLFADEIAGRMYFNYLCATQAGVKVYQTVELPGEYWDEKGRARFYDEKNGNFYLFQDYPTELKIEKNYSIFHIDKLVTLLRDQEKEKIFAERVSYMYWGGWLVRNLSPSNTAVSCGNDLEQYGNFIRQTFKPANFK